MFSKLMNRRKNLGTKGRSKDVGKAEKAIKTSDNPENTDLLGNDAERRLYQHKLPEQEQGFGDLLNDHRRGERFPYVMITTDDGPTLESRISFLQRFQALIQISQVQIPKRINLHLSGDSEEVSFESCFGKRIKQEFVLLKRATFILTPLSSMFDVYTDVTACIVDKRFRGAAMRQTLILSSNKDYTGELSLDYSIPKKSLSRVFFCLSLETPIMNTGEQWASVQLELDIEESDHPQRPNFKEVLAVAGMANSGLTKYNYNPMRKDLTIHNNHRDRLLDMNLDGDLARPSDPESVKTGKLEYSKSSASPARLPSALKVPTNDWDAVRNRAPDKIEDDKVSLNPPSSTSTDRVFPIEQHGGDREAKMGMRSLGDTMLKFADKVLKMDEKTVQDDDAEMLAEMEREQVEKREEFLKKRAQESFVPKVARFNVSDV